MKLDSLTRIVLPILLIGCHSEPGPGTITAVESSQPIAVAPPLVLDGKAYDTAGSLPLPERQAEDRGGLYNVYELSPNIVSGSEPAGREALEALRDMGVRTILSVDGKAPEAVLAAELGMRYVHVPIQYRGITGVEMERIAKSFRELEAPFYVHCFHGKHRGPAAAAVGRVVIDGVSRETAIAEMRQYCGTSGKYEGLYHAIAADPIPDAEQTAALDYAFETRHELDGIASLMVAISRAHDHVADLQERGFVADPEHPDVDARNEAQKLEQAFEAALSMDEVVGGPQDLRDWFIDSRDQARRIVLGIDRERPEEAAAAFAELKQTCNACHDPYRN